MTGRSVDVTALVLTKMRCGLGAFVIGAFPAICVMTGDASFRPTSLAALAYVPPAFLPAWLFELRVHVDLLLVGAILAAFASFVGGALLAAWVALVLALFPHVWATDGFKFTLFIGYGLLVVSVAWDTFAVPRLRRQVWRDRIRSPRTRLAFLKRTLRRYDFRAPVAIELAVIGILLPLPLLLAFRTHLLGNVVTNSLFRMALEGLPIVSLIAFEGARRHAARRAEQLPALANDTRFLFLRSFEDDELGVAGFMDLRALLAKQLKLRPQRLEPVIERSVRPHGSLVAIGQPGEELPRLGATRAYVGEGWREEVRALMRECRRIFVLVGATPNLSWEIETLVETGSLGKLVLILLPDERVARWRAFYERFGHLPEFASLAGIEAATTLLVQFDELGRTTIFTSRVDGLTAYREALAALALP